MRQDPPQTALSAPWQREIRGQPYIRNWQTAQLQQNGHNLDSSQAAPLMLRYFSRAVQPVRYDSPADMIARKARDNTAMQAAAAGDIKQHHGSPPLDAMLFAAIYTAYMNKEELQVMLITHQAPIPQHMPRQIAQAAGE